MIEPKFFSYMSVGNIYHKKDILRLGGSLAQWKPTKYYTLDKKFNGYIATLNGNVYVMEGYDDMQVKYRCMAEIITKQQKAM